MSCRDGEQNHSYNKVGRANAIHKIKVEDFTGDLGRNRADRQGGNRRELGTRKASHLYTIFKNPAGVTIRPLLVSLLMESEIYHI